MERSHPQGSGFFCVQNMDLVTGLLLLYIAIREGLAFMERREMFDRLMAKSLPEYKETTTPEDNQLEDVKDNTVPIEEAESELVEEDDGEEE